ncbi:unnamed protein product, partial [Vitis vinifera]|uniref:Uncharacterized protein n=1 Tax=Vitis vinifera TaxID=29760 RepID=D7TYH3_VITVI
MKLSSPSIWSWIWTLSLARRTKSKMMGTTKSDSHQQEQNLEGEMRVMLMKAQKVALVVSHRSHLPIQVQTSLQGAML